MAKLVLATCQFRIEKQVKKNLASILRQMRYAKTKGAKLIHFSEACLCGYLGSDLKSVSMMDWDKVARAMQEIMSEARKLGVWVVLGSNHKLTGRHKPHNSLYVIDHRGRLVNRYDKRYCTDQDLEHYSPGQAWVTFKVSGVTCGLLICHDFRYPELFRQYKKRGVQLMLVSFHMAGMKRWWYDHYQDMVPATLQAAAGSNYFAISSSNGTRRLANTSFVVNAEGGVVNKARPHRDRVLITTIDTAQKLYDASQFRRRCLSGVYHSGKLVKDARSHSRTRL